jgi:predicted membrane protein
MMSLFLVVMQTTSKFFINNFSAFFKRDNTAKSSSFFIFYLLSHSLTLYVSLVFSIFPFLYILFHSQHVKLSYVIKIFYSIHHIIRTTNHEEMRMRREKEVKHQQQEYRINESGCDISFLWISLFVGSLSFYAAHRTKCWRN